MKDVKSNKLRDIQVIELPYKSNRKWEQWVLLMSDEHWDSKHCDRRMLKKHHEQAKERNAIIMKFGDIFDMMQGKFDPRGNKGDLRPELQVKDYFTELPKQATEFYSPYRDHIKHISTGNHELSVMQRQEVDVLGDMCERLGIKKSSYNGFVRFKFQIGKNDAVQSFDLYYTHGSGGSAPVTRGTIKTNRRQYVHADLIVSGHTHNEWVLHLPTVKANKSGTIKKSETAHISLGTYKDEPFAGDSWANTKEFMPSNKGGAWVRFFYDDGIKFEITRAQ